jgi:hypothetical protein
MASGKLGSADLAAATDTLLFTSTSTPQTFNVRFANRNSNAVRVRVAISTAASPTLADYVDYDVAIQALGILEDTGLVCSSGEKIFVRSDTAGVSVRAHGI